VDQDRVTGADCRSLDERFPGRARHQREARGLNMGEVGGFICHDVGSRDVVLGVAPVPGYLRSIEHLVAGLKPVDGLPDGVDDTGDVVPGDEWGLQPPGVPVLAGLHIYRVDTGRVDLDPDLVRSRFGDREVCPFQYRRATEARELVRIHNRLSQRSTPC